MIARWCTSARANAIGDRKRFGAEGYSIPRHPDWGEDEAHHRSMPGYQGSFLSQDGINSPRILRRYQMQ